MKRDVAVWCLVFVAFSLVRLPGMWRTYRLRTDGVATTGTVVKVEPERHAGLEYAYRVGTREYRETQGQRTARVGDPLTVYYVRSEPGISCIGEPEAGRPVWFELLTNALTALAITVILRWGVWIKKRRAVATLRP